MRFLKLPLPRNDGRLKKAALAGFWLTGYIVTAGPCAAHADTEWTEGADIEVTGTRPLAATPSGERILLPDVADRFTSTALERILGRVANVQGNDARGVLGMPIAIRGIAPQQTGAGVQQSVAVFVDGVFQGGDVGANVPLSDIQSISLTKGPGSPHFARSAIAGAIDVRTRQPERDVRQLDVSAGVASQEGADFHVYASRPITPELALNLSGDARGHGGFGTNLFTGSAVDNIRQFQLRSNLLWRASEKFELQAGVSWGHVQGHDPAGRLYAVTAAPSGLTGLNIITLSSQTVLPIGGTDIVQDIDPQDKLNSAQARIATIWHLPGARLRAQTAQRRYDFLRSFDGDASPVNLLFFRMPEAYRSSSHEIELSSENAGKLQWRLGGSWASEHITSTDTATASPMFMALYEQLAGLPGSGYVSQDLKVNGQSHRLIASAFASADWQVNPSLGFSTWMRWSHEQHRLTLSQESFPVAEILLAYPTLPEKTHRRSFANVSPGAAINWEVSPSLSLRLSAAAGYKPGGFWQTFVAQTTPAEPSLDFQPETLLNYEARVRWTSTRATFNLAAFRIDWRRRQIVSSFIADGIDSARVINCCNLIGGGFEGDITVTPASWLQVRAEAGYVRYTVRASTVLALPVGARFKEAPGWNASAGAVFKKSVRGHPLELALNGRAQGPYDLALAGGNAIAARQGAFFVLDSTITMVVGRRLTLGAWIDNLTNVSRIVTIDQTTSQLPWIGSIKAYAGGTPRRGGIRITASY